MKIFLVRHGETEWNRELRFQGHKDSELTEKGLEQAAKAGDWLEGKGIGAVYCSDLKRAKRTAEIIGAALGIGPEADKNLRECNYGKFEGLTIREVEERMGAVEEERREDKYRFRHPGGESYEEMERARIIPFLGRLGRLKPNKTVLVVAHAGTNKLIIGNVLKLGKGEMMGIWQPNDCIYILDTVKKTLQHAYAGGSETHEGWVEAVRPKPN